MEIIIMSTVDSSIQINRPVEAVYAFLTQFENQKLLQPGITAVTLHGPLAVGTRYTQQGQVMGRNFSTENEIVALEPNKKLSIKTLAAPPASPVTNTYSLEAAGGGTLVTTTMDAVMGGMPGFENMIKQQLKAALDSGNAALKKALEAQ
jgi:carbon monoxide dehydrogenase subunit G